MLFLRVGYEWLLQFGSYFGATLCAVDVNNDGFDDLLVGAPFYNQSLGDEGAVSLFLNLRNVCSLFSFVYCHLHTRDGNVLMLSHRTLFYMHWTLILLRFLYLFNIAYMVLISCGFCACLLPNLTTKESERQRKQVFQFKRAISE